MVRKYGAKHLEKAFEFQLALIVQSLGLLVVSSQPGERAVDLICISSDPTERGTLLLEAKTSGRPYALPTKDERALLEYIEVVRRSLTTLPPLRLVVILGQTATSTLEGKLAQLEGRAGVPIRFCTAQELADLRESVPGPIAISSLLEAFYASPRVLPRGTLEAVSERYRNNQSAHSAFVKALLPERQRHRIPQEWPEPSCDD